VKDLMMNKIDLLLSTPHKDIKPCILICGYTGAGKTSIVQLYCGKKIVPDSKISHSMPKTQKFTFYSSNEYNFWDCRGLEPNQSGEEYWKELKAFAKTQISEAKSRYQIPIITWYCIQGSGGRVTPADLTLLKELPLINMVLITKNEVTRPEQRIALKNTLIQAGIPNDRIKFCSTYKKTGFKWISRKTASLVPEAIENLKKKKDQCFVATAIYDDEKHIVVERLRSYRDEVLIRSAVGRQLIHQYWIFGPKLAKVIIHRPSLKRRMRRLFDLLFMQKLKNGLYID
jgi:hypothetical protein